MTWRAVCRMLFMLGVLAFVDGASSSGAPPAVNDPPQGGVDRRLGAVAPKVLWAESVNPGNLACWPSRRTPTTPPI